MLASVFTKSLRDRWLSTVLGMSAVALMLPLAMASYSQMDTSIYDELPEAFRALAGIPTGAEPAVLAFTVTYGLVGGLTLAGIAVSMGAASIAGEERNGTIGVLLANPRSRRQVFLSAVGASALLLVLGASVVLLAAVVTPLLLGIEVGGSDIVAPALHLWLNALVWGALAAAVGGWTGNRSLASAVGGGTMVASYVATGLLQLFESTEAAARWVPWYWFDGHQPLVNGVSGRDVGLQVGAVVVLAAVGWWGVEHRDLRSRSGRSLVGALVDRVRESPAGAAALDRLSGTARIRNVAVMEASRGQALLLVTTVSMFLVMGVAMGPIWVALEGTMSQMELPEEMLAIFGGGDMSTPAGYYRLEVYSLMAPIATALVGIVVGARALAGEERDGTLGLLLSAPITRRSLVLQKAAALLLHVAVVGGATWVGVIIGVVIAGVDLPVDRITAASLQTTLLGAIFGLLALAIGGLVGRSRMAALGASFVAVATYALWSVVSVTGQFEWLTALSPFDWALGDFPLVNGVDWAAIGLMLATSAALLAAAVVGFERRDLGTG